MPTPLTNPFPGTPDVTQSLTQVLKVDDTNPPAGLGSDYANLYTARFTTTFVAGSACTIDLLRGSDDGMRVKVNGATVIDDWGDYAYRTTSVSDVPIVAGSNTIVVEYYERSGNSGYELAWED